MPRPLRPFAGRWSLVAAVLLPGGDSESASPPAGTFRKTESAPDHPIAPSPDDEALVES